MHIWNTIAGRKEEFPLPERGKPLRLFVCGPTVYDRVHIGNARVYIFFDTFARYLRARGIKVFYLQNITDIDDKIIARAKEERVTPKKLAQRYTRMFRKNMRDLRVTAVTKYAPATRFIPEIISQISRLIKKGHAYKIENDPSTEQTGGWYFDLKTFPDYGKLSGRTVEQAEDGVSRIDASEKKRNRGDFCLWKFADANTFHANDTKGKNKNEPVWHAPFGNGRPGWHIEDTAISEKFFGPQYDIHGAGRDLIFPHHEAEIAQQESASGKKPFVKIWMHIGLVTVNGKKMSKSLGNFLTIDDFLSLRNANTLRFIELQSHYRSPLDLGEKTITDAETALLRIEEFMAKIDFAARTMPPKKESGGSFDLDKYNAAFHKSINDDMNTGAAIAAIFSAINGANDEIWNLSASALRSLRKWLENVLFIFGIAIKSLKIPSKIRTLAKKRELFRIHEQFAFSDALRQKIEGLGYKVEDTPRGPLILPLK